MSERLIGIRVSITRYVSDDPQPGIVECGFLDAHNRYWNFVEKTAIVSSDDLQARTAYPQPGVIACEIVSQRQDALGRGIVSVDIERPFGVQSKDEGIHQFEVFAESIVEWERGSFVVRDWNGEI
jgi:hypothetical protein